SQGSVDAAHHLGLSIEIDDALFDQTRQLEIAIKLEHLFGLERSVRDARPRLTFDGFARRILCADAHLKSRTATTRATFSIFIAWFLISHGQNVRQTSVCRRTRKSTN